MENAHRQADEVIEGGGAISCRLLPPQQWPGTLPLATSMPCASALSTQGRGGRTRAFSMRFATLSWCPAGPDGTNIAILDRWAEERIEWFPGIVRELIGSGVSVLVTAGTAATLAARRANATIPIVLVGVDDPVSVGLVDTLAQPGGNVTGLSLSSSEVIAKRLDLLRQLVPGLHRLAVIVRDDPGLDQKLQDIRSNAQRMGIETLMLQATTARAVELAFAGYAAIAPRLSTWRPARWAPSSALGLLHSLTIIGCP